MSAIKSLINPHTLKYCTLSETAEMSAVDPSQLLDSARLDVMARYIYAKSKISGRGLSWGRHCYHELIRAWSQDFKLPPPYEPGRSSMQDYWDQFNALIDSVQDSGFDTSTSVIPTCDGTIIDGAHRLAASLACGVDKVFTVPLEGDKQIQDYKTLRRIRIDENVLLHMVYEFIQLKPDTRMAVLFPVANSIKKEAKTMFEDHVQVDYHEEFPITLNGLSNLQHVFYGQHEWWNIWHAENFAKLRRHKHQMNVNILFFQEKSAADTRTLKEKIRTLHSADTHTIHATDTHAETLLAGELLLNKNGRKFLDISYQKDTPLFDEYFYKFRALTEEQECQKDVALDTGSVLSLHGLRDITDVDYISCREGMDTNDPLVSYHADEYDLLDLKPDEIIDDPSNHFIYKNIKFVSLDLVTQLKQKRATPKDLHDLILIDEMTNKNVQNFSVTLFRTLSKTRHKATMSYYTFHDAVRRYLKAILPDAAFEKVRQLYRSLKKLRPKS